MKGASEYYNYFKRQQKIGKLYIEADRHARGRTLHVWVLISEDLPINSIHTLVDDGKAVEVYGVISGQPGWTEAYGWLHEGPWIQDFKAIVEERKAKFKAERDKEEKKATLAEKVKQKKIDIVLKNY